MHCDQCGTKNWLEAAFCQRCGASLPAQGGARPVDGTLAPAAPAARLGNAREFTARDYQSAAPTQAFAEQAKVAPRDALHAFRSLATDPVGRLATAYDSLGKQRALGVGAVFALLFDVSVIASILRMLNVLPRYLRPDSNLLKLVLLASVPLLVIIAMSTIVRKLTNAAGSIEGDVFYAGATMLPFGLLILLSNVIGLGNFEVIAFLAVFVLCYTLLMLYSGAIQVARIPTPAAAFMVPVTLLLAVWCVKVVLTTILADNLGNIGLSGLIDLLGR